MQNDALSGHRRVLVVDDNLSIHEDFRKVLTPVPDTGLADDLSFLFDESTSGGNLVLDYQIDFAVQGEQALELATLAVNEQRPYAAMFVDMRMPPGWDGLTTIERIWAASPDTQAVICTAYSDYTWQEIVDRLGVSDRLLLIQKPFSHLEVQQAAATLTTKWNQGLEVRAHMAALETNLARLRIEMGRREAAEHRALHDAVTGLPNRTHFIDRLRVATQRLDAREHGAMGLGTLDIDRFRPLVEGLGHILADAALAQLARRLEESVRHEDLIARTGPDQFCLLALDVSREEDLVARMKMLQAAVRSPFELDGHRVHLTASAGATLVKPHGPSAPVLLHQADAALNRAREEGGDTIRLFSPEMLEASSSRMQLLEDLQGAIETGAVTVNYQPIIDLKSGRIAGFEALGRWHHPERGWVSPATFVPIAEDSRLIIPLGAHVLETACRMQVRFGEVAGRPIAMSINVSAVQIAETDLVATFRDIIESTGCAAPSIRIELTESAIMRDPEAAVRLLDELRALSAHIYVDDFGTGYSSLSYLQRLPVDALKIDCSFTSRMHERAEDFAIVQTIMALASALGLTVVAEGVESAEPLALLRQMGCDFAQGFYFSRPITADKAIELLEQDPTW